MVSLEHVDWHDAKDRTVVSMMTALTLNSTVKETGYNFRFAAVRTFVTAVVHQPCTFFVQPVKSGNLMTAIALLLFTIMGSTHVFQMPSVECLKELMMMQLPSLKQSKNLALKLMQVVKSSRLVEEGKSIDEVLDLAEDVAPEKISRVKDKVKQSMNPMGHSFDALAK